MNHDRTLRRALASATAGAVAITLLPITAAHADRDLACTHAPTGAFDDVAATAIHAANIDCIAAYGIAVGVGGGNYDSSGLVSRGQMASFLVNFFEVTVDTPQAVPTAASPFTDIGATTHADNIRIAASLGITSGRTPSAYEPAERVTRGQMATFVAQTLRAAEANLGATSPDRFTDDDGWLHEQNIDALAAAGVVAGIGGDAYDPHGHVTRAQMATFLANAAGLLSEQDAWLAPPLPVVGPSVELVLPAGEAADVLEVRWTEAVTTIAVGADFEVAAEDGETIVARGTTVSTPADDVIHVELDTPLAAAGVYWLRIAEDVVTDAEDHPYRGDPVAFTFTLPVVGGGGSGAGGSQAPEIVRVETRPESSRLAVTFDLLVTCPTGGGAADAWSFANTSIEESPGHASGAPQSVEQTDAPSTECFLVYPTDSVENGDHGVLSYTQPGTITSQVRATAALASVSDINVIDTVAPTFDGLLVYSGSETATLEFSEPVACSTLDAVDFEVAIAGADVGIESISCEAPAADRIVLLLDAIPVSGDEVAVEVVAGALSSDQSRDNRIVPGTQVVSLP